MIDEIEYAGEKYCDQFDCGEKAKIHLECWRIDAPQKPRRVVYLCYRHFQRVVNIGEFMDVAGMRNADAMG